MSTQVFRGKTKEAACRAAREALGPSAVVLTTRRVPAKSVSGLFGGVEFEAHAVTETPSLAGHTDRPREQARDSRLFAKGVYEAPTEPGPRKPDDMAALRTEMRTEMRTLRSAIAKAGATTNVAAELASVRHALEVVTADRTAERCPYANHLLEQAGIDADLRRSILASLAECDAESDVEWREALRDRLAEAVRVVASPLVNGRAPTLVSLVGPSGVGKTTTAAKLVALARLEEGATVTIISTDAYRVGAFEQMRRYAELLDVSFETATTPEELERAVNEATTDWVVIDTGGQRPIRGEDSVERCIGRLVTERQKHTLLCLPANMRISDAMHHARAFAATEPTALAITKIDETDEPSGLIHAPLATNLPVAVVCNGPRVPEDIAPATAGILLDHVLPLKSRGARNAA